VPLQDLVQHDAVEEAAQAQAEEHGAPHHAPASAVPPAADDSTLLLTSVPLGL
jgi:hypothetical protein